jgi:HAD superfamily hydrolase (TIGR01490 family)
MTDLSIFDLDNTLTKHGTYSPFLLFAARRLAPWRLAFVPVVVAAMVAHKSHLITRAQLKMLMQSLMIGRRVAKPRLTKITDAFAAHTLARNFYPKATALIAQEKAAGRRVIIATAAHRFYLEPIAAALGITDIIGTASVWDSEALTPAIAGPNCHGPDKKTMVTAFLAAQNLDRNSVHIRFYSDHHSDLPTLDWADEPIAVNPTGKLQRHALRSHWPILSLA